MNRKPLIIAASLFGIATLCIGCDEEKKVPISKELQEKRNRVMPDGKIPDPRTAQQKLNDR
jgi:hypothetical protein